MTSKVILVLGSLQNHAAVVDASRGGYCPCIGTTDFGMPKLLIEYEM